MKRWLLMSVGLLAVGLVTGWSLARTQESTTTTKQDTVQKNETTPETPLDTLDWLVGDWVDTSDNVSVELSCHFTKNGAFLLRSFNILTAKNVSLTGMQLIAWDAAKQTIRSWTYDSKGGFGEEVWSQSGNHYTIRAKYTLPDGGTGASTQVVTFVDNNKFTWKSVNREIDGEFLSDTEEVFLVRKPVSNDVKGAK
jgi:hypothetical protein